MPVPTDKTASSADDTTNTGGADDSATQDTNSPSGSDAQSDASSASNGQDAPEKSGIDIVREALAQAAPSDDDGKATDPNDATKSKTDDAKATGGDDTKTDAAKAADKSKPTVDADERPEDANLPFNKHPRWIERGQKLRTAMAENEALKSDKARFEQDVAALKPKAEASDVLVGFMNQHKLSGENLQEVLDIAALLRADPAEARKRITNILEQLDESTGEKLPADLKKKVDDGDLEVADALEISRARARAKTAEAKASAVESERTEEKTRTSREQAQRTIETTVNTRLDELAARDVDFAKKQDLLQTYVLQAVQERRAKNEPFKSVADIRKMVDDAYAKANQAIASFAPKPAERKPNQSSSQQAKSTPDLPANATGLDVVKAALGVQ